MVLAAWPSPSRSLLSLASLTQVNLLWALAAILMALGLYVFVNWRVEAKEWGSAMDGITFRLALSALVRLEQSQHQRLWRRLRSKS